MVNEVPIFPLNSVLFPGGLLSLQIFEPRYLSMVSECMQTNTTFLVTLIVDGKEVGTAARFHNTGTLAQIVDFNSKENTLLEISCRGKERAHVIAHRVREDQLVIGQIETFQDDSENSQSLPAEYSILSQFLAALVKREGMEKYREGLKEDWNNSEWISSRLSEILPLTQQQHYDLLLKSPIRRLKMLKTIMMDNNWLQSL